MSVSILYALILSSENEVYNILLIFDFCNQSKPVKDFIKFNSSRISICYLHCMQMIGVDFGTEVTDIAFRISRSNNRSYANMSKGHVDMHFYETLNK